MYLAACGSSPLTRGKPRLDEADFNRGGLIPAHAGKTMLEAPVMRLRRAHPRSRGENLPVPSVEVAVSGSSPLTRGKRGQVSSGTLPQGLIPAHAGKTMTGGSPAVSTPAHPRSRGENAVFLIPLVYTVGSSPLTRGKP